MRAGDVVQVAIIIPAYNEGPAIRSVIDKLQRSLSRSTFQSEIIVVDDGSLDNTLDEARSTGVHVIKHLLNSGPGGATATGLRYARTRGFDIACTCDGDGQHSPKDVLRGITILRESGMDLLIGSRLTNTTGMSRLKVLGNKGLTLFTRVLFGVSVVDSQSGLRILSKRALNQLQWKTTGYDFCSEMLWRAKQLHLVISEFPIQVIYTDHSKAKGQSNWNAVNIIRSLARRRVLELFSE